MKPYYEEDGITIYHGDARDVLSVWGEPRGAKLFDLLLTDPPYGIFADRNRGSEKFGWRDYGLVTNWDKERADAGVLTLYRALCREAIIWGGNYFDLPQRMGWLVWDKGQREFSLADGELAWTSRDVALRIFQYTRGRQMAAEKRQHPTQKPLALLLWCLGLFRDSQSILDPYMGSGTTLVAAKQLGRQAVGIEREERYCEMAVERLAQGGLFVNPEQPIALTFVDK